MAVYGRTTQGADTDNIGGNGRIRANSGVFPENGTLNNISAWVDNVNPTTSRIIGMVYDSSDTLIAVSDVSTTTHSSASVITLNVAGSISLVAGETYRIGVWGENNSSRVYRDAGAAGAGNYLAAATWPTPPSPYSGTAASRDFSISLDYTPAVAGVSLTAPDTVTHGVATTATGASLSTVNVTTGMTLEYGTVAIAQTATYVDPDLNFTPDVGVPTLYGTVNAVASLPLTPDSASAGTTAYQVTLEITDG